MVWEVVFMLVLLKIPLVYLCLVVWWAIRAEPRDEQPAVASRVSDTPIAPGGHRRPQRTGPAVGGRRGPRPRVARRRVAVTDKAHG
jgi:hypothetical protein